MLPRTLILHYHCNEIAFSEVQPGLFRIFGVVLIDCHRLVSESGYGIWCVIVFYNNSVWFLVPATLYRT
jgi:hypothetical protein